MRKWIYILLGAFVIIAAFWWFNAKKTPVTSEPGSMKELFVEGCMEEGAGPIFCGCTYDELVDDVGRSELLDMSVRMLDEVTTEADDKIVTKAVSACLK